jgi:spermidine synthase
LSLAVILLSVLILLFTVFLVVFIFKRKSWLSVFRGYLESHTDHIDGLPVSHIWFWIALSAGVGLFAELMIIRIHGSFFQMFAYFKNVSLLSCFLGLGIGYIRGRHRPLLTPLVLPLLFLQILLMYLLRFTPIADWLHNPISEITMFGFGSTSNFGQIVIVYAFMVIIYGLNAVCMIPFGQLVSRLMMRSDKLPSYSWNLIGSLVGIILFSFISFAWTPPWVWVLLCTVGVIPFLYRRIAHLLPSIFSLAILLIVFVIPFQSDKDDIYSPYQIISLFFNESRPPEILACNTFHQRMFDLRDESIGNDRLLKNWQIFYDLPYSFKHNPGDVLILGSGTGNDVAAGIRKGAGHIDAVEIDPVILESGKRWHPEGPYRAASVNVINDDARSVIRHSEKKYDLIIYGLLDSHSLLSGRAGGVRLDSYVYTVECFKEARKILKAEGMICLSFCVMKLELGRKLYMMLAEAFDGRTPRVYQVSDDASYCFLIGNKPASQLTRLDPAILEITPFIRKLDLSVDKSTDDWPFFYMPTRRYPLSYLTMIMILAAVSMGFVRRLVPGSGNFSIPCFFLGAGFMLVETKSITELALVYGSTWLVISIVIAAILIMAFLANLMVIRFGSPRPSVTYSLLGFSLLIGLGISFGGLEGLSLTVERLIMTLVLTLPLFFSGFAFSTELKKSASVAIALSSNLLGAMLGGFLEYNAMYFGYRSLYILALVMYGIAFFGSIRGNRAS